MQVHPFIVNASLAMALALPASAQLAPGEGVRLTMSNSPPGLEFLDLVTSALVPVTGATGIDFNAGVLDPATMEIVASGHGGTGDFVYKVLVVGTTMLPPTVFASTGVFEGIEAIDIGPNGHFYFTDGPYLWKADRHTGAVTLWDSSYAASYGSGNSLAINSSSGKMYLGTTSAGTALLEYDIAAGPAAGSVLFDIAGLGWGRSTMGLAIGPVGEIFVASSSPGAVFGGTIYSVDPATGSASTVLGAPNSWVNDLEFDRNTGLLNYIHAVNSTEWMTLDPATGAVTVIDNSLPGGGPFGGGPVPAAMAINDLMHTTTVFPREGSGPNGFLLEMTAHGNAGDFAGVGISAINGAPISPPIILGGIGVTSGGGHYPVQIPIAAGLLSPGMVLEVVSGTLDPTTGVLTFGMPQNVVITP